VKGSSKSQPSYSNELNNYFTQRERHLHIMSIFLKRRKYHKYLYYIYASIKMDLITILALVCKVWRLWVISSVSEIGQKLYKS